MGKAAAKPKTAPGKDVVKKAAKRVNKAAAAKSPAKATAKAAAKVKSWTTFSPEVSSRWGDCSCVPSCYCRQEGHQQLLGPNEEGKFRRCCGLVQPLQDPGKVRCTKAGFGCQVEGWQELQVGTAATLSPLRRPVPPRSRVLLAGRRGQLGTKVCFFPLLLLIPLPSSGGEIANEMHRNPGSPSFKELLDTLESSSEKWDESLPQEKFLKDKGEKKYFWSSASGLAKFEEVEKHSEEFSSSVGGYDSKGGKPKGGATAKPFSPGFMMLCTNCPEGSSLTMHILALSKYCWYSCSELATETTEALDLSGISSSSKESSPNAAFAFCSTVLAFSTGSMPGGKSFLEVEAREGLLEEESEETPARGDSGPSCWIILQTEEFSFFPLVLCFFFKSMCLRPASSLWAHAVHSPAEVSLGKALPIALCRKEIVILLSSCSSSKHSSSWFSTRTSGSATKNLWDSGPPGRAIPEGFHSCHQMLICPWLTHLPWCWKNHGHTHAGFLSECKGQIDTAQTASSNQPSAPLFQF